MLGSPQAPPPDPRRAPAPTPHPPPPPPPPHSTGCAPPESPTASSRGDHVLNTSPPDSSQNAPTGSPAHDRCSKSPHPPPPGTSKCSASPPCIPPSYCAGPGDS